MEKQTDRALSLWMEDAFRDKMFLRKLGINRTDLSQLFDQVNWRSQLSSLVPIRRRISCAEALAAFRPLLDALAPEPAEGWLRYAYQVARSLLYPAADPGIPPPSGTVPCAFCSSSRCSLPPNERTACPLTSGWTLTSVPRRSWRHSGVAEEYRRFLPPLPGRNTSMRCCG